MRESRNYFQGGGGGSPKNNFVFRGGSDTYFLDLEFNYVNLNKFNLPGRWGTLPLDPRM